MRCLDLYRDSSGAECLEIETRSVTGRRFDLLFHDGFAMRDESFGYTFISGERVKRGSHEVTYRFMPWELLEAFGDRCTMRQMATLIDDHLVEEATRSTQLIAKQDDFCDTGFFFLERDSHPRTYSSQYFWRFYSPQRTAEQLDTLVFKSYLSTSKSDRIPHCTPRLKVMGGHARPQIAKNDYIGRLVIAYARTAAKKLDAASWSYETSRLKLRTRWQRPMVLFRDCSGSFDSLTLPYCDEDAKERLVLEHLSRRYPRLQGGDISLPALREESADATPAFSSAVNNSSI